MLVGGPLGDGVAADAGRHAQVQGVAGEGCDRSGRILEGLRFDRPDHDLRTGQHAVRRRQRSNAKLLQQHGALGLIGLYHHDAFCGHALADQAADDGTGHITAADEGNGRELGKVCGAHGERPMGRNEGGASMGQRVYRGL
ncbi:hypothetical protein D3C72_1313990 [compost metagenome]